MADERELHNLLKETTQMAAQGHVSNEDADNVLEQLQKAVEDHEQILRRQAALIERLRKEMKDVRR